MQTNLLSVQGNEDRKNRHFQCARHQRLTQGALEYSYSFLQSRILTRGLLAVISVYSMYLVCMYYYYLYVPEYLVKQLPHALTHTSKKKEKLLDLVKCIYPFKRIDIEIPNNLSQKLNNRSHSYSQAEVIKFI